MKPELEKGDYLAYFALAALSLCFGSAFYFNVLSLHYFGPVGSGAGRIIVAALFVVPIAIISGQGLPNTRSQWLWVSILGLFGMLIPFMLVVWAQLSIVSNITAAYFASVPLLMLLFSRLFLKVHITKRKWLGLALGSAGLVLLSGSASGWAGGPSAGFLPQLALVCSCLLISGSAVFVRLMPSGPPVQTMAGALLIAAIAALPFAIADIPPAIPPMIPLAAVVAVGVLTTGIGNLLRFFLIRRRGPVFITPNAYLSIIVALVLGVVLLGEPLLPTTMAGLGIIFCGLLIAQDGSGRMERR